MDTSQHNEGLYDRLKHLYVDIALAEKERSRLAAIVEDADDAIISKDLNGIIETWNGSAERLYGYSHREAIGQHISMLAPDDRKDEVEEILQRIRRGERVRHFETIRVRRDGTPIRVSISVSPIRDIERNIVAASIIARQMPEIKQLSRVWLRVE